jgi:hypothetical protein
MAKGKPPAKDPSTATIGFEVTRFASAEGKNGEVACFDPVRQVAISDTHRGNLILMEDGLLAPTDLRVQALSGALLDYVVKACRE